jgi:hypothetical protein
LLQAHFLRILVSQRPIEETGRLTKSRNIAVVASMVITVIGVSIAIAFEQHGGSPLGGSRRISDPRQCQTVLLKTIRCRGEDTSFQECHYYFRAEGVPRADVCRAFLDISETERAPDAGVQGCSELSPAEWKRVPCGDFMLPADFACFSCSSQQPEASRELVQAFTPMCDRAIVVKGCNVDIAKMSVGRQPATQ